MVAAVQRGVDLLETHAERHLGLTNSNLHEVRPPPPGLEPGGRQRTHATRGPNQPYGPGR
jgi:hypothetical protein